MGHVAHLVRPFSAGGRREIIAQPKVFGFDTGMVCHARGWDHLRSDVYKRQTQLPPDRRIPDNAFLEAYDHQRRLGSVDECVFHNRRMALINISISIRPAKRTRLSFRSSCVHRPVHSICLLYTSRCV